MSAPLPWSHSILERFNTCPHQLEQMNVLKNFQDSKNSASTWGDEVHKVFERYIRTMHPAVQQIGYDAAIAMQTDDILPPTMKMYEGYLKQFVTRPGLMLVEQKYAINRALQPCDFFDPMVWGRGIIDVLTVNGMLADVDDHKTGKRKVDMQQLVISAVLTFYHHPGVLCVRTRFHWVKTGEMDERIFFRHQLQELWTGWPKDATREAWEGLVPRLERYAKAFHIGVFNPKKSGLCRQYCPVKTCEYCGGTR
jgi:hypothetical protein